MTQEEARKQFAYISLFVYIVNTFNLEIHIPNPADPFDQLLEIYSKDTKEYLTLSPGFIPILKELKQFVDKYNKNMPRIEKEFIQLSNEIYERMKDDYIKENNK